MDLPPAPYIGRFAPSPTGDLHFGSVVAAAASFLCARTASGKWLIRIEDLDPPREVRGAAGRIISDLQGLGMIPDAPVLYQSSRLPAYADACQRLLTSGEAFWCGCSRSELPRFGPYPGTCRDGIARGRKKRALRIRVGSTPIEFTDRIHGLFKVDLKSSCGDFVIRRADGFSSYQLAVVIDDAFQHVTEVVRGADLLDSAARQIWLQRRLGLPTPSYVHVPLATDQEGRKLSKRDAADPVGKGEPVAVLRSALQFLGHDAPETDLHSMWRWAIENWSLARIPRMAVTQIPGTPDDSPER